MREAQYADREGRFYVVLLPDDIPDAEAYRGMPIGPPPLDALGLPPALTVRLHNELFVRRILTERDATRRPGDIVSALTAALKLDAMAVMALYAAPVLAELPPPDPEAPNGDAVVDSEPEDEQGGSP